MNKQIFLDIYNKGEEKKLIEFFDVNLIGALNELVEKKNLKDIEVLDNFDILNSFTYSVSVLGKLVTIQLIEKKQPFMIPFSFHVDYMDTFDIFVRVILLKAEVRAKDPEKFERLERESKKALYEKIMPKRE